MRQMMLTGTLAAVLATSTMAPALAQGAGGSVSVPAAGRCMKAPGFLEQLNLSDDQLEKLHAIKTKHKTETAAKSGELKVLHIQLREILAAERIDRQAAASVQAKINALRSELSNARLNSLIEKSEVFTAEQRKEIRHRMLEREARGGGRRFGR